jgi:hypothetical protein
MKDITREMSVNMQRGIREAKQIQWGPLSIMRVEFANGTAWGAVLRVGRYMLNLSLNRAEEQL